MDIDHAFAGHFASLLLISGPGGANGRVDLATT
jgi:hypothetical protein